MIGTSSHILESGRVTAAGDRRSLMGNPVVQKAYVGAV